MKYTTIVEARQALRFFTEAVGGVWRTIRGRRIFIKEGKNVKLARAEVAKLEAKLYRPKKKLTRNQMADLSLRLSEARVALAKAMKVKPWNPDEALRLPEEE